MACAAGVSSVQESPSYPLVHSQTHVASSNVPPFSHTADTAHAAHVGPLNCAAHAQEQSLSRSEPPCAHATALQSHAHPSSAPLPPGLQLAAVSAHASQRSPPHASGQSQPQSARCVPRAQSFPKLQLQEQASGSADRNPPFLQPMPHVSHVSPPQ